MTFLFGFAIGFVSPFILGVLYGIMVFLWGDWRTGEISWGRIKKLRIK